jgi:hypothetical protein
MSGIDFETHKNHALAAVNPDKISLTSDKIEVLSSLLRAY